MLAAYNQTLNRTYNWALNPNPWHSLSLAIFHQCHSDFLVTWPNVHEPPFISFLQNQAGSPLPPQHVCVYAGANISTNIPFKNERICCKRGGLCYKQERGKCFRGPPKHAVSVVE